MTVRENRGFTLIELLVVIGIAGILAAIALPISDALARQRDRSTCFFNLKTIGMALENYRQDFRGFPPDITETVEWGDERGSTRGLGLYTLYYLTAGYRVPEDDVGSYLSARRFYHCPRNPVADPRGMTAGLPESGFDATFGGWNNYDGPPEDPHYRRLRPGLPEERQLIQPFPAPTTVVTWCDLHHRSGRVEPEPGDQALVLWVDQTVDWITVRYPDGTTVDPATATQKQALQDRGG
jgi:prepilin-type N-terminal cleavage/methylation domain-containing protein